MPLLAILSWRDGDACELFIDVNHLGEGVDGLSIGAKGPGVFLVDAEQFLDALLHDLVVEFNYT